MPVSYVFFRIEQVAPQEATVLLLGETGAGKGWWRARFTAGARVRTADDNGQLHVTPGKPHRKRALRSGKRAFTGPMSGRWGAFELADGGTIFLDEIGEMPLELQCKLLRVIQDGEFERLGSPPHHQG